MLSQPAATALSRAMDQLSIGSESNFHPKRRNTNSGTTGRAGKGQAPPASYFIRPISQAGTRPDPFLRMPVELRLQVYEYVIAESPSSGESVDIRGLFLSCRRVHQGIDAEYNILKL
jgi:hypothetical protein